jgi:HK97 family phage portal protein
MVKRSKESRGASTKGATYMADVPAAFFTQGAPQPEQYQDLYNGYNNHVWVFACIRKIAENLGSLNFLPYRKDAKKTWQVYEQDPFYSIIQRPNTYVTYHNLIQMTVISLEITGNAFWVLIRKNTDGPISSKNPVNYIWPVPPHNITVVPGIDKPVDHYEFRPTYSKKTERLEFDEVIHFKNPNPKDISYGLGPLQAAKVAVTSDLYAMTWNEWFFRNNARPDSIIETDKTLTPDIRKRLQESWKQNFQGSQKRGKLAILEGGLKYHEVNRTPKDMDFINLRKLTREEILAAFDVPPAIVGLFEYANYANSREQTSIFWKHCLLPRKTLIADTLSLRFSQLNLDMETFWDADTHNVDALRPDEHQRAQTFKTYVDGGIPLNQVIKALELPFQPIPGGDVSHPVQSTAGQGGAGDGTKSLELLLNSLETRPLVPSAKDGEAGGAAASTGNTGATETIPGNLMKDPKRTAKWKAHDAGVQQHETKMHLAMKTFFKRQKGRVMKSFDEHGPALVAGHVKKGLMVAGEKAQVNIASIFDESRERPLMMKAADGPIKGAFYDKAQDTFRDVKKRQDKVDASKAAKPTGGFDFNLHDENAQTFIEQKKLKLALEANAYTKEQIDGAVQDGIQEAIAEGMSQGEALSDIADRISSVFDFADQTRADRIARTEVVGASNAGATQAMTQAGADGKEWLTSRDDKVRDTHAEAEGQQVGPDENFKVGDTELEYPGDPSGPPEEIVNCRCTVIPVVKGYNDD